MANKIVEFDISTGNWEMYVERLEMVFLVQNVKEELKVPTLISVVGESAYELMVNLCSPAKPKEKNFAALCKLMADHLQPKPSVLAERYKFRQCRQQKGTAILDYFTELKKRARFCEFGANLDENMRDQFVCGVENEKIRQRLFTEAGQLGLAKAVQIATSIEAAERDASAVETVVRGEEGVHNLQGKGCLACGDTRHNSRECRFQTYECSRCRKIGHLRRVCPEVEGRSPMDRGPTSGSKGTGRRGGAGTFRRARGAGGRAAARTHHLEESTAAPGKETQRVRGDADDGKDGDPEEPVFQMSLSDYKPIW